ncbi:MAG: epimerase [Planctomycetota bacterium]|jgi:nucleoside-diphosphate-sugar epimerase|nr:epimerase [Planctomycetota bacterium]
MSLPQYIEDETALDEIMTLPTEPVVELMRELEGDILILGINGKMGLTLGRLAVRAIEEAGVTKKVIGVSRFSDPAGRQKLEDWGIETIKCDLLNTDAVAGLPQVPNIIFMAGRKFGTQGSPELTWAMNTLVPSRVCDVFSDSSIVAFSTGNVYPFTPVESGGATEIVTPDPVGDYAQSCLGREMMFTYYSHEIPVLLFRLNYAIDLRYGVLYDLAQKVMSGETIDLAMGHVNIIWQGDANALALRCLPLCASPARPMNIAGPETLSIRSLVVDLGNHLGRKPVLEGEEAENALLSNSKQATELFGPPTVDVETLVRWTAHWVKIGGSSLNKPTHFEVRSGKF